MIFQSYVILSTLFWKTQISEFFGLFCIFFFIFGKIKIFSCVPFTMIQTSFWKPPLSFFRKKSVEYLQILSLVIIDHCGSSSPLNLIRQLKVIFYTNESQIKEKNCNLYKWLTKLMRVNLVKIMTKAANPNQFSPLAFVKEKSRNNFLIGWTWTKYYKCNSNRVFEKL